MSKALVWKNNASPVENETRVRFVWQGIMDGPKDERIEIVGLKKVRGDKNNDFIVDPKRDLEAFDAVHTFVVVREAVTMYQRALWRIGKEKPLNWQWGPGQKIGVHPRAGNRPGACYSRRNQSLKFYYCKKDGKTIFTSRSPDTVLHECGHAILDALRPGYWSSWQPQTSALHEAFADITAILSMFSQMDQCEAVVAHSKGNLHRKTYFNSVAGPGGDAFRKRGLHSADNNKTLEDVSDEISELSQVFTGAFYDISADMFSDLRNPGMVDDAETLYRVGEHMTTLLVEALLKGPPQNATFEDIAEKMIALEKNKKWKSFMRLQFGARRVLGKNRVKAPKVPIEMEWKNMSCCMSSEEHIEAVEESIRRKLTCLPCKPTVF